VVPTKDATSLLADTLTPLPNTLRQLSMIFLCGNIEHSTTPESSLPSTLNAKQRSSGADTTPSKDIQAPAVFAQGIARTANGHNKLVPLSLDGSFVAI